MHDKVKKFILLNAGTKTRNAFFAGLGSIPHEYYQTKNILLHITHGGSPSFIYNNKKIDWSDSYVFTRLRATDQQFSGIIYDYLKHHNIPANDPINHSYVNSAEKISQMLLLALHGITIPETFIFREESYAFNHAYLEEHISFPSIYKTDGSRGRNVHYVTGREELETLIQNKKPHVLALIQPFIENTFDTRTIVAYGEVLGSIGRTRTQGYLNNIAQGAHASQYTLSDHERDVAIKAASVCGIDVAGVDMIHTKTGPIVLEVNKSPQIHGFESVYNFKVFTKIASMLKEKYQ